MSLQKISSAKLFAGVVGLTLVIALVGVVGVRTADAAALTSAQVD